jgi:hypothetical protein
MSRLINIGRVRSSRLIAGVLAVALAGVILAGWAFFRPPATAAGPPIVYFADRVRPGVDVGYMRAQGVLVVNTLADFEAALPAASGLILDRGSFAQVPQDVLAREYQRGRVIAAINVPVGELKGVTGGYATDLSGFKSDWGDRTFYSLVRETPAGVTPKKGSILSDQLPHPAYLIKFVQDGIRYQGQASS